MKLTSKRLSLFYLAFILYLHTERSMVTNEQILLSLIGALFFGLITLAATHRD